MGLCICAGLEYGIPRIIIYFLPPCPWSRVINQTLVWCLRQNEVQFGRLLWSVGTRPRTKVNKVRTWPILRHHCFHRMSAKEYTLKKASERASHPHVQHRRVKAFSVIARSGAAHAKQAQLKATQKHIESAVHGRMNRVRTEMGVLPPCTVSQWATRRSLLLATDGGSVPRTGGALCDEGCRRRITGLQ
jgi:hypothetical protein